MDIQFENLSYKAGENEILKSINGRFSSGCLSSILGSSGAGKTTLLSILAGHLYVGVNGKILVNGKPRKTEIFQKCSCYLLQENLLRTWLTVRESINFAAKLKNGKNISTADEEMTVHNMINLMGLVHCADSRVENLSGGESKRLSIAMEIVNNPVIAFLDEPTTGLDNVSAMKLIRLLKHLSSEGRAIICTIHQPSDLMFQEFDQVYFMSDGNCVYRGNSDSIVHYLAHIKYPCPPFYAPFDYLIELVHYNQETTIHLKNIINNGEKYYSDANFGNKMDQKRTTDLEHCLVNNSTSFWKQSRILINLKFTQMRRERTSLVIQSTSQIILFFALALLFQDVGKDGDRIIRNIFFFFANVVIHVFIFMLPQVLLLPPEIELLRKEYFNGWYSLGAYYTAITITSLPLVIIPVLILSPITYVLTDQLMESRRFLGFILISVITAAISQEHGRIFGSLFKVKVGAILAPGATAVLTVFAMYGMGYGTDISIYMTFVRSLSFIRHAFDGYSVIMLNDRRALDCDKIYCHFNDPQKCLRMFGIEDETFLTKILLLTMFLLIYKFTVYIFLKLRLMTQVDLILQKVTKYLGLD